MRYFLKIVELGSFSAASRVLYVAQPALTKSIADLESHLGVRLLTRSTRGVTPTLEGEKLCRHANLIFRCISRAEADVRSASATPQGKVLVALPLTLSGLLTPGLIGMAVERFPGISLEIVDQLSSVAGELVETGRVDFGLLPNAAELSNVDAEPLYREEMYLIGRCEPLASENGTIRFSDLGDLPLVLPSRTTDIRRRIEQAAIEANRRLNARFEQNSNETIRAIVSAGLAHTILPWHVFAPVNLEPGLSARRIVEPEINRTFSIAWSRRRSLTVAASAVKRLLVESLVDLQQRGCLRGRLNLAADG